MAQTMMTAAEVTAFLDRDFPELLTRGRLYTVESVGPMCATMTLAPHPSQMRPGGTVSGPAMMALADVALYVAILAQIGPVGLAVTTNFSMNFLRRPAPGLLRAECRVLKLGRRLAVGDVGVFAAGEPDMVAHATATYSIPPKRSEIPG
jgi:uncharacterized protein (TIGR00369 family)